MAGALILIFLSYMVQQFLNIRLLFQVVQARCWYSVSYLYFKISLWNERNHLNNICIGFSETDRLSLEHKLKYLAF